jgi:tetratricopeptide (TPR) repeat protein
MNLLAPKWLPDFCYLVSERAYLLHSQGRYYEALALFEGLLEIDPGNIYCRDAASALYLMLGKPEEAVRHATLVISSDPTHVNSIVRRCEGYLMLGRMQEARSDLQRLRELHATVHARRMEMRLKAAMRSNISSLTEKTDRVQALTQLHAK